MKEYLYSLLLIFLSLLIGATLGHKSTIDSLPEYKIHVVVPEGYTYLQELDSSGVNLTITIVEKCR